MTDSDHDLLMRLDERVGAIQDDMLKQDSRLEAVEKDTTILKHFYSMLLGATGVIAFVFGMIADPIKNWIARP